MKVGSSTTAIIRRNLGAMQANDRPASIVANHSGDTAWDRHVELSSQLDQFVPVAVVERDAVAQALLERATLGIAWQQDLGRAFNRGATAHEVGQARHFLGKVFRAPSPAGLRSSMNTQLPFCVIGTSRMQTPDDRAPAKISTISPNPNPL